MHPRLAKLYLDAVQVARGWDYRPALRELEALQWAPLEEVRAHRQTRLRSLLSHCKETVPFYRQVFERLGMTPAAMNEEDLRALPIITKATLHEDYSRFQTRLAGLPSDIWASSGSTGEPFAFRRSKDSIATTTFAGLARGRRWWGLDYGVREGMIWSGLRDLTGTVGGRLASLKRRISWRLKNARLVDVYDLDHEAIREAYSLFLDWQPVLLRTIASGLYRFATGLEELGLDGTRLGVRAAIFTGEGLSSNQRQLIERVIGCKTIGEYGCTELGVIAFECPSGGMHVSHDSFVVEYLKDGQPAKPGQEAELVLTNLSEKVAPLVRYAVGDLVVPSESTCECGRTLPVVAGITGRTHDCIRTPDGREVHGLFFTHLFDRLPVIRQFQIVQSSMERIRMEVCAGEAIPESVIESLHRSMIEMMGPGVSVEVEQVPELPVLPSGKTPWIVSKVDRQ